MLGMSISSDNRYVAAFTSARQLAVVDIILGQSVLVERPMEEGDDIVGVCFAKEDAGAEGKGGGTNGKVTKEA